MCKYLHILDDDRLKKLQGLWSNFISHSFSRRKKLINLTQL